MCQLIKTIIMPQNIVQYIADRFLRLGLVEKNHHNPRCRLFFLKQSATLSYTVLYSAKSLCKYISWFSFCAKIGCIYNWSVFGSELRRITHVLICRLFFLLFLLSGNHFISTKQHLCAPPHLPQFQALYGQKPVTYYIDHRKIENITYLLLLATQLHTDTRMYIYIISYYNLIKNKSYEMPW